MSSEEAFEDAEIDGLSQRSWFGSCLRGVLVGAVLFIGGVIALSLSNPLPEHLPGVGKVEIVRNDKSNGANTGEGSSAEGASSADAASTDAAPANDQTAQSIDETVQPAADNEAADGDGDGQSGQQADLGDDTVETPQQAPDAGDQNTEDQAGSSEDQTPVTAAAPSQPEIPPGSEDSAAPALSEQQAAAQPNQASQDSGSALTDGGTTEDASAQPAQVEDTEQPSAQPQDGSETVEQQTAVLNPEQPAADAPIPTIDLPGPALDVNARPFESPEGADLLAVILMDANNGAISPDALQLMTMPLTLAVGPGEQSRSFAEQARAAGHEVLAQIPMSTEEGAQDGGLTPGQPAPVLTEQSTRLMADLDLAIGATASDQAPLLKDPDGMAAIMDPLAPHGFMWIDPRQGIGSAAKGIAARQDVIWGAGDRFVEASATEEQIYQNLESAAGLARRQGTSIVFVTASSDALKALVRWGLNRGGKEVWFAPVSAVIKLRQAR
ncbi:MAG: divergent polysaccharide deacetylase family protein [Pseudomonadota bacterium]